MITHARCDPATRDRGDTMLMTTIIVAALMIGAWALVSAGQQWGARRDAQAVAQAAARAAVQVSAVEVRGGQVVIDPVLAGQRAADVASASGYTSVLAISGTTVTVTVTGAVDYAYPAGGFPDELTASGTATVQRGVLDGR
ncbi:MAG TPA: pilus assembly protein TadG-related protein [Ilumatobacter sp.]|nr:pilus assembly protein TadG-related protein [Ilumatobacter sp.]